MTATNRRYSQRRWAATMGGSVLGSVLGAALLAACSSGADQSGSASTPEPSDSVTETGLDTELAFASPDADDFNKLLTSQDGLSELQPVEILGVDTLDPHRLVISFEMESHHCFGVHTAVEESEAEVFLDITSGRQPGISPSSCTYGVFPYTVAVELAAPLGERSISAAETGPPADDAAESQPAAEPADAGTGDPASVDPASVDPASVDPTSVDPTSVDPTSVDPSEVGHFVGRHVEDGVEWALANNRPWRIVSQDGKRVDDGSPEDPNRVSFTVVADVIVSYHWS